jgi:hypothetical protein
MLPVISFTFTSGYSFGHENPWNYREREKLSFGAVFNLLVFYIGLGMHNNVTQSRKYF